MTSEVTQADREAAWPYSPACYSLTDKPKWDAGVYDQCGIIQAFARHREQETLAALSTPPAPEQPDMVGELVEALEEARDLFRNYERHHRAKISEAGRPEKAERNRDIADRIDAALTKYRSGDA